MLDYFRLLLSAFPILLVFAALRNSRLRRLPGGIVAVGAAAMIASLALTAVYHAGYSDFRSDKLRKPVTGDLVWSVPTLATLNPIGAPIAKQYLYPDEDALLMKCTEVLLALRVFFGVLAREGARASEICCASATDASNGSRRRGQSLGLPSGMRW